MSNLVQEIRAMVLRSNRHPVGTHEKNEHGVPSCTQLITDETTLLERAAARIEQLEQVIEDANNVLWDTHAHDIEHAIEWHADSLPERFRRVATGAGKALEILQVVVRECVEERETAATTMRARIDHERR